MKHGAWLCGIVLVVSSATWGQQAKLNVKPDQPGFKVSPTLESPGTAHNGSPGGAICTSLLRCCSRIERDFNAAASAA